jgi:hypothetical protein
MLRYHDQLLSKITRNVLYDDNDDNNNNKIIYWIQFWTQGL